MSVRVPCNGAGSVDVAYGLEPAMWSDEERARMMRAILLELAGALIARLYFGRRRGRRG